MDNTTLYNILYIVIVVISLVITRFVIPWVYSHADKTKLEAILRFIKEIVNALEQVHYGEKKAGAIKKGEAVKLVSDYCKKHHINLTDEQISSLIEAAARDMNWDKREEEKGAEIAARVGATTE